MRAKKEQKWNIVFEGFDPKEEKLRETLCAVGNGYFVSRFAAPEESASAIHYPGTYIAGVYNKTPSRVAGRTVYNEDLVNCPNWLYLTFRIGDSNWFSPSTEKLLFYKQTLNMKKGTEKCPLINLY